MYINLCYAAVFSSKKLTENTGLAAVTQSKGVSTQY